MFGLAAVFFVMGASPRLELLPRVLAAGKWRLDRGRNVRSPLGGAGCDGLTMITLRSGVEGSLTPCAHAPAGLTAQPRAMIHVSYRQPFPWGDLPGNGDQLTVLPNPLHCPFAR